MCDERDSLVHKDLQVRLRQCLAAQLGDDGLLVGAPLYLLLRALAVSDIPRIDSQALLRGVYVYLEPRISKRGIRVEMGGLLLAHGFVVPLVEDRSYGLRERLPHVLPQEVFARQLS